MKHNEHRRLNAVNRFKQLGAGITKDLNDLVSLVADTCNSPVALVTLLDEDKQWFKAAVGTEIDCTDRKVAFCNKTILKDELHIINDMLLSEFAKNPLVTGEPHVRFYAGVPLITKDGYPIGSLCVIDMKPRELSALQKKTLTVMAKQVVNLMELNYSLEALDEKHKTEQKQNQAINESELKLKALFDSSNDTHLLIDKNYAVLAFNKSAATFINSTHRHKIANGDSILDYIDKAILNQFKKYFNVALSGRATKREWLLMRGTANACWKITTFIPVKNAKGDVIGVALNSNDITHHKKQEEYINIQNEALNRIAIIQSHELRRPVASLLGIMDLLKMENIDFTYFEMMELTINELDEKIRGIVKDSENTLHGRHLAIVA
ncbi:GAF domain-containing protein [Mucilaginibacter glaciei]|uniref:PAS domain S-box protein n=1 Tax=Mucilaginibacter glaciei TaxID=2772109 RepID=A0A926NG74_9SPHI|nr:GAF domain-containing protein [Mucilaginibacter glaciei]MBD1391514.1 PAS domain S-box protein [Mucilaginibacter glaciei]